MFQDTPFIWGRFPKFIMAWAIAMQFWAGFHVYKKHAISVHLQEKTRKAYRRSLPFVQSMEDIRYCAIQERNYMIFRALCDMNDPKMFDLLRSRYNQEDTFLSYYRGSTCKNFYDGRYGTSRFFQVKGWRLPEDEKGLVTGQQVSTYG